MGKNLEESQDNENMFDMDDGGIPRKAVTVWLPETDKEKYDIIQNKSCRKFSKRIRNLVIKEINETFKKVPV